MYTKQLLKNKSENKPFYSVKQIFKDNWESYLKTHEVREIEKQEVEKMLSCKDLQRGYFVYQCKNCNTKITVPFGCNSRLCSCCGKRHTDKWADRLMKKMVKGVEYRHLTFSVPDIIWFVVRKNRSLQKVLMDAASQTIKEMFSKALRKEVTPSIIEVLHPFGRDLIFKPHVHPVVTNGGFTKDNKFVKLGYINYDDFHKTWQYNLLTKLRKYASQKIINYCFNKYPNGFVAYIKPQIIYSGKHLVKYIGRYLRHPAIANSRIVSYDKKNVRFYYEYHKKNKIYKTMSVDDFISAIIQHVPEKNMRLVRYYGLASRNNSNRFGKIAKQSVIEQRILFSPSKKRVVLCEKCGEEMILVEYVRKPPD